MQVLCIVAAQGGVRCSTIHTVKIVVHSTKDCCTASTVALTSIEQGFAIVALIFSTLFYSVFSADILMMFSWPFDSGLD